MSKILAWSWSAVRFFASLRFSVIALGTFAVSMAYGTIRESMHGADYARMAIYHSAWFYLLEGAIILSLVCSVLVRLPLRQRLAGFYTIHLGIVVIFAGALVTRFYGVDGNIELRRGIPSSSVRLFDETLLHLSDGEYKSQIALPASATPVELNKEIQLPNGTSLTLVRYLPFAGTMREWRQKPGTWFSEWQVRSKEFNQSIELFEPGDLTWSDRAEVGAINVRAINEELFSLLQNHLGSKLSASKDLTLVLVNHKTGASEPIRNSDKTYVTKSGDTLSLNVNQKAGVMSYRLQTKQGSTLSFYPRFSTFPVDAAFKPDREAGYALIDLSSFNEGNTVLVARDQASKIQVAFRQGEGWQFVGLENGQRSIKLPWADAELTFLREKTNMAPENVFVAAKPGKDDKQPFRALLAKAKGGEAFWITNQGTGNGHGLSAFLGPREIKLPFEMTLGRFKMDQVPGTDRPASFESFIEVSDSQEPVHVYMNNPYKAYGFTFYQSSYFQDESGQYNSVLSVNRDPGRATKYAGSAVLVIGLILHFFMYYGRSRSEAFMRSFSFGAISLLALLALSAPESYAADTSFCTNPALEQAPILTNGRIVPLFAHARTLRKGLFPSKTCPKLSDTALYCLLSLGERASLQGEQSCVVNLKIEHRESRKLLGLSPDEASVAPDAAISKQRELFAKYHLLESQGQKNSGFGNDLSRTLTRIQLFQGIESGEDWKILNDEGEWVSLASLRSTGGGGLAGSPPNLASMVLGSGSRLSPDKVRILRAEAIYEKTAPFSLAIPITIIAFALSLLTPRARWAGVGTIVLFFVSLGLQVTGIVFRTVISERAPIANMYETVMFAGITALLFGAVIAIKRRDWRIWAMAFFTNCVCLFMMRFATGMLDSSIQPLVPVLRDNFWLSTHVTAITIAYGCFMLSWIVANFVLVRLLFAAVSDGYVFQWNTIVRTAILFGNVFLAAGILLGAVWADYSWGRFWGWDPKETWSLIVLVVYALVLHGRLVGWFTDITFVVAVSASFLTVLMTWFGVNYILATGLHSYGFSSGGAAFLGIIFAAQVLLLGAVGWAHLKRKDGSTSRTVATPSCCKN